LEGSHKHFPPCAPGHIFPFMFRCVGIRLSSYYPICSRALLVSADRVIQRRDAGIGGIDEFLAILRAKLLVQIDDVSLLFSEQPMKIKFG
jgi:hypothetical protein